MGPRRARRDCGSSKYLPRRPRRWTVRRGSSKYSSGTSRRSRIPTSAKWRLAGRTPPRGRTPSSARSSRRLMATRRCASLRGFEPPGQTTGELTASTGAQPPETPCVVPAAAGYARLENQLYRDRDPAERRDRRRDGRRPSSGRATTARSLPSGWRSTATRSSSLMPGATTCSDSTRIAGSSSATTRSICRRDWNRRRSRRPPHRQRRALPPRVRRARAGRPGSRDAGAPEGPAMGPRHRHRAASGAIPIPAANTAIAIEGGIEVTFSAGSYRAGDYWMIPARTFSGAFNRRHSLAARRPRHSSAPTAAWRAAILLPSRHRLCGCGRYGRSRRRLPPHVPIAVRPGARHGQRMLLHGHRRLAGRRCLDDRGGARHSFRPPAARSASCLASTTSASSSTA